MKSRAAPLTLKLRRYSAPPTLPYEKNARCAIAPQPISPRLRQIVPCASHHSGKFARTLGSARASRPNCFRQTAPCALTDSEGLGPTTEGWRALPRAELPRTETTRPPHPTRPDPNFPKPSQTSPNRASSNRTDPNLPKANRTSPNQTQPQTNKTEGKI